MIRKLKLLIVATMSVALLTACQDAEFEFMGFDFSFDKIMGMFSSNGNDDGPVSSTTNNNNNDNDDGEENKVAADGNNDEEQATQNFEKVDSDDLEQIFENMAKAIKPVESIYSEIETETADDDGTSKTTTKIKTILNPLIFHVEFDGDIEMMEMYANESEIYATIPGQDGWVKTPDEGGYLKHATQQINEDHILHYNNYLDHFEASSDDTHYIINYIGPDEMFNEIFLNENLMKEVFGDLHGLIDAAGDFIKLDYSGDVTMRVNKDTFLLDEQEMDTISTTSILGFEMESKEHTMQTLTYDQVEPFSIPDEAINNALDTMEE